MKKLINKLVKIVSFAGFNVTDDLTPELVKNRAQALKKDYIINREAVIFRTDKGVVKCYFTDPEGQLFYLNTDFINKLFSDALFPLILKIERKNAVKKYRLVNVELAKL